ncbi:MAG: Hint domain-containing protein [Paracoccaceae bacterium]
MVARLIFAADNEAFTVAANSPSLSPGTNIINNSSSPNGTIYDYSGGFGEFITIDDTNNVGVFDDDDRFNHVVIDGGSLVANGTQVESESLIELRELDENGIPFGPVITINVYSKDGDFEDIWGFSATENLQAGRQYIKVGGSNNGDSNYTDLAPCFTAGTEILTESGLQPVETIEQGDSVWTRSSGFQIVRWSGRTTVSGLGDFAPVWFSEGAVGNTRAMRLSPNHRVLYASERSELMFADREVLIPARFFVGLPGVSVAPVPRIDYFHFMFDAHEIVESDGCLTESFFPGEVALKGLEADSRNEVLRLFPELERTPAEKLFPLAATPLRRFEARMVLDLNH